MGWLPQILQAVCLVQLCLPGVFRGDAALLTAGIVLSRLGLWTFDLAERQLVQNGVQTKDRALLFNWERSVCNAALMVALLLTTVLSDNSQFWILAVVSTTVVCTAAVATAVAVVQVTPSAAPRLLTATVLVSVVLVLVLV